MARFPYDVNTNQRYIDVHKQFGGGLKTVDTDDALGAVFLRDAQNISLSEFGFIEKRYGSYEIESMFEGSGKLQGYYTYVDKEGVGSEIVIYDGRLYLRIEGETQFTEANYFRKEGEFKYDESIFGQGQEIEDYITFSFSDATAWNPATGGVFSNSVGSRTASKFHLGGLAGFHPLNSYTLSTNNFSYLLFWDKNERYIGYYGSPLAETYTVSNQEITLADYKKGKKPIAGEKFIIPSGAEYVAIVRDLSTFTDEESNTSFVWGHDASFTYEDFTQIEMVDTVGGTLYPFTVDYYPFQNTKEVDAVSIKEELYIFNGTYPVYYKGGSNFYAFPMYTPSANDVINAGHNFFETRPFEEVYGFEGDLYELGEDDNFLDPSLDFVVEAEEQTQQDITPRISFTQQEWYPKLPFAVDGQRKGELNFELNYNYSKELSKIYDPYLYSQDTRQTDINESDTYTNVNYVVRLDHISYGAANSSANAAFTRINPENISTNFPLSNYTGTLNSNNKSFAQYRVRDGFGLFRTLVNDNQLNNTPSPTHEQADPDNPVLNTDSTKRNFLGGERNHPYGIDQQTLWYQPNERDLGISIHEKIVRTADTGNLSGRVYGIRFKEEISEESNGTPIYAKLDFKDIIGWDANNSSFKYGALGGISFKDTLWAVNPNTGRLNRYYDFNNAVTHLGRDKALSKYLSSRFIVMIKPIVNNVVTENRDDWKLLWNDDNNCYFEDSILYFKMPEFPDRIDGQGVTGYVVEIKTVNIGDIADGKGKIKDSFKENYDGKASRSILVTGSRNDSALGLRRIWPGGFKPERTELDYNLFESVGAQETIQGFGKKFTASVTELIPGSYDFKLTFAVDETTVPITKPQHYDNFKGAYDSNETYADGDIVSTTCHTSVGGACLIYNYAQYNSSTQSFNTVEAIDLIEETDIGTNTQYISIYFRNIQIFNSKITDYVNIKEDGVSPLFSCTRAIEHYGKVFLYNSEESEQSVFVSFPENFNYYPSLFKLEFYTESRDKVEAITPFMNVLVVQTKERTWGIKGTSPIVTSPDPYSTFMISPSYGTIAPKSVKIVRNQLMFLSHLGVVSIQNLYAIDNQYNVKPQNILIKNLDTYDPSAVAIHFDDQYWLNLPQKRITLRWYVDKKAWVLDKYDSWKNFNGVFQYQTSNGELQMITLPSIFEGDNLKVYRVGIDYTLPYDLGKTFTARFETSYLNQNYPFHPKNYKETKLDFTLQNEYNLARTSVYEMESREHINDNDQIHHIDNVEFIKNHTYRIYYNFGSYVIDFADGGSFLGLGGVDIVDGGDFSPNNYELWGAYVFNYVAAIAGGDFELLDIEFGVIDGGGFEDINYDSYLTPPFTFAGFIGTPSELFDLKVESVFITDKESKQTVLLSGEDLVIKKLTNYDYTVDFYVPNSMQGAFDVYVYGNFQFYDGGATVFDVTYDDSLTFKIWVISEDQTLNLDNVSSYDQAKADVNFEMKDRMGEWVFGSSDFGNKVTAVKTIKLSGKGYNAKMYFEDFTNSKWTLESLGLTYKMKRARSR